MTIVGYRTSFPELQVSHRADDVRARHLAILRLTMWWDRMISQVMPADPWSRRAPGCRYTGDPALLTHCDLAQDQRRPTVGLCVRPIADGDVSRRDGAFLLAGLVAFLWVILRAKPRAGDPVGASPMELAPPSTIWTALASAAGVLVEHVTLGAHWLVSDASALARDLAACPRQRSG